MLTPVSDSCPVRSSIDPYWDPVLKRSKREYWRFIRFLDKRELLRYTVRPSAHAGIFFLWKKGRERIRIIVDGRSASEKFRPPRQYT